MVGEILCSYFFFGLGLVGSVDKAVVTFLLGRALIESEQSPFFRYLNRYMLFFILMELGSQTVCQPSTSKLIAIFLLRNALSPNVLCYCLLLIAVCLSHSNFHLLCSTTSSDNQEAQLSPTGQEPAFCSSSCPFHHRPLPPPARHRNSPLPRPRCPTHRRSN